MIKKIITQGLLIQTGFQILLILLIISISLFGSGCTDNINNINNTNNADNTAIQDDAKDETATEIKLQIAGSTTVLPIAEECARVYMEKYPGSRIYVSGGGSSHGVKAVADGTVDIATASRDLKSSEMEANPDLVTHGIAKDGVAVIIHTSNMVNNLTMEQLQGIFAGGITNWKEVGGDDSSIMVVSREEGSGTRDCFEQAVMKSIEKEITDKAIIQDSNGKMRTTIAGSVQGIGFLSLGYVNSDVKAVKLNGIEPSVETILNDEYAVSRTLWMVTKGEPDENELAFIDFVIGSEGQKIVEDVHFIPVD